MQILVKGTNIKEMQSKLEAAVKDSNNYYNGSSFLYNHTKTKFVLFGKEKLLKNKTLLIQAEGEHETKTLKGEKTYNDPWNIPRSKPQLEQTNVIC